MNWYYEFLKSFWQRNWHRARAIWRHFVTFFIGLFSHFGIFCQKWTMGLHSSNFYNIMKVFFPFFPKIKINAFCKEFSRYHFHSWFFKVSHFPNELCLHVFYSSYNVLRIYFVDHFYMYRNLNEECVFQKDFLCSF